MQIRAAVTDGSGESLVHELLELEEPGSNEVLVRVVSTGLCQTDAHVRHQRIPTPLPLVLGDEGAGEERSSRWRSVSSATSFPETIARARSANQIRKRRHV